DGIRDRNVTGVQTCALPISKKRQLGRRYASPPAVCASRPPIRIVLQCCFYFHISSVSSLNSRWGSDRFQPLLDTLHPLPRVSDRSEERRVGKECSIWWSE